MLRPLLCTAILLTLPGVLPAQSHPLAGTWNVTAVVGMEVRNGDPTPLTSTGVLELAAVGDSLVGTIRFEPLAGTPARPPARLAAKMAPGPLAFVHRGEATINRNGSESKHAVTSTYRLEAKGDSLSGTVEREIEGAEMMMPGPQAISGTRAKPAG